MEDTLVIDTVEKLKIFADPLRQRLLQAFCCNPATIKQVAEQMEEKPARLYHHVDLLEQSGFLEIVETKQVRGTVEKTYQTVARKIIVDHALVGSLEEEAVSPEVKNVVMNTLQACLVDARDNFD
jgi:predicted ArsR family transcriptional regulator